MGLEVEIVGDNIVCSFAEKTLRSTPLASIVLIAEYTTNRGRWSEDMFLLIKSFEQGKLLDTRVPDTVIGGLETLVRALQPYFGSTFDLGLSSYTVWNSRVMWPEALMDEKLFTLDPIVPVGAWQRLKRLYFGPDLSLALTQPVRSYLKQYEKSEADSLRE